MNAEESAGMDFYFPARDQAFHWVRNSSLYSPAARQHRINVRTMFRREEIGASVPVFDRFEMGFYFRKLHALCLAAGAPYLIDLDDLIWELPEFSSQSRLPSAYLVEFPERLTAGAAAITVSTPELKEHVERRFPEKTVFLVENSLPAWVAPRSGVLIANLDAFKMGKGQIGWFIDLLRLIFEHGLSIQLLGQNENLLDACCDIVVHSLPVMDYCSYLRSLASGQFRMGLLPVEHSSYADCKSAIKAIEFLAQRMPTVASDIAPYRRFAGLHDMCSFRVVPNTYEEWKQAVETFILQIPEEERRQGREINALLKATRDTQFQQWLAVVDFLHDRKPHPETMQRISRKMRPYRFAYTRIRPMLLPIRNLLKTHL